MLLLSILNMPRMDGITLIQKLRLKRDTQKLPIMVISGMSNAELDGSLHDLGVSGIIRKPIFPSKIVEIREAEHDR